MKSYFVYILASDKNGTLYVGVTSDLVKRIHEHKTHAAPGFTSKYGVERLVYFEQTHDVYAARERERNLKAWKRAWKIRLIERMNPGWGDLYLGLL